MVTIVFRTDIAGVGTGKGARLTKEEVDGNFFSLKTAVEDLVDNPVAPLEISDITVVGNQMTIKLSDLTTTFGPFTLPVASMRWMGNWLPEFAYKAFDIFRQGDGLYIVKQNHTSSPEPFDPDASDVNGEFYELIMPLPTVFDIGFFFPGQPGRGIDVGRPMFSYMTRRDVYLQAGLPGSGAHLKDAPADDLSFPIVVDNVTVGSIDFAIYEPEGTFSLSTDVQLSENSILEVLRPIVFDASAHDLTVTISGKIGTIPTS